MESSQPTQGQREWGVNRRKQPDLRERGQPCPRVTSERFARIWLSALRFSRRFQRSALRWCLTLSAACLGVINCAIGAPSLSELPRADFWIPDGPVNAVLETNGVIYLGGQFDYLRPNRGSGIALDLATQQPNLQFPQVNGVVLSAVSDGSGGFFLGGEFTEVGGVPRENLAYIHPDNTVDPNWNPGADARVEAMALAGRTLYVAGLFTSAGGEPCDGLAALDAFVGKATGWAPVVEPKGTVTALVTYRGHAIAAGTFNAIGGEARNGLAMIDRETADPIAWDPDPQGGEVRALALDADTVYVGGTFTSLGGQSRIHIAAVDAVTALATEWNPAESSESESVDALAVSGNTVFVGGRFTYLAGKQVQSLGALDTIAGSVIAWKPNPIAAGLPEIRHLAVAQNRVYVSGTFTNIGGLPRNGFAALDQLTGNALPWTLEFSGDVSAIATSVYTAYAGGAVVNTAGVPRSNLAALDASTGMPTSWDPQVNGEVHALAANGTWIVAGGEFSNVGGLSRSNLAAIYPISGAPVSGWSPAISGPVRTLAVSANNEVFAGGDFTFVDGQKRNHLASILANGSLSLWNPNANGAVRSLVLVSNSVYVGGDFTTIFGITRTYLAEISLAGSPTSWNPKANGPVVSLAVSSDGIFAGGQFTQIGGEFRNRLALLNPLSGAAQTWNPNVSDTVRAIAVSSETVYVGGDFTSVGGEFRSKLAGIEASSGSPTAWNPSADDRVNTLAATTTDLFVGGNFTNINTSMRPSFAAFGLDGVPVIVTQPTNQMLWPGQDLSLTVGTTGLTPLSYQWQFNGNDIPNATTASLTLSNVQPADAGPYALIVSNSLGRVRSDDAVLTVLQLPVIDAQPVSQTNSPGKGIELSVAATGSPALRYSWRLNGAVLPGAIGPTLTIPRAQATNSGSYSVVAANAAGVMRSSVATVVVSAPSFPFSDYLENGTSTSLTSGQFRGNNELATSEPGEPEHGGVPGGKSVWMVWNPKGVGVAEFNTLGSGFDTVLAVYTNGQKGLEPVVSDDDRGGFHTSRVRFNVEDGVTYLIAIDGYDGASGNLLLNWNLLGNVQPIPMILEEPTCQVAAEGSDVSFTVLANGADQLTYQWYLGSNRLPGETESTLTLRRVTLKDVGSYRVRLSNGGSLLTESLAAALQLAGPIVFGPDQKYRTKMAYISGPPPSFGVSPGTSEHVDFNNAEAEATLVDPTPCQTVLGSDMVQGFHVTAPGLMIIDTEGSEVHTVLVVVAGEPPNHTVVDCVVDGSIQFCPDVGTNYYAIVGGLNGARGYIQVNMRFCGAPEVNSFPSMAFSPVTRNGDQTILAVEATNETCGLTYRWYRNGVEIPGAIYPTLTNDTGSTLGNTYSVVVTNCAGSVSNVVASFLRLWIERNGMPGMTEYRLRADPPISSAYVVHDTEEFSRWNPIHTNPPGATLNLLLDPTRTVPSEEFFRIWPQR